MTPSPRSDWTTGAAKAAPSVRHLAPTSADHATSSAVRAPSVVSRTVPDRSAVPIAHLAASEALVSARSAPSAPRSDQSARHAASERSATEHRGPSAPRSDQSARHEASVPSPSAHRDRIDPVRVNRDSPVVATRHGAMKLLSVSSTTPRASGSRATTRATTSSFTSPTSWVTVSSRWPRVRRSRSKRRTVPRAAKLATFALSVADESVASTISIYV